MARIAVGSECAPKIHNTVSSDFSLVGNTVYLIGAGINQIVKNREGLSPPLVKSFFQVALKMHTFSDEHHIAQVQDVYDFIEEYWHKTKSDLLSQPFDLEECFTFVEAKLREATEEKEIRKLLTIRFKLAVFVAQVLSEFEREVHSSLPMLMLGELIYEEKPMIITFNYDYLLESAIQSASRSANGIL